MLLYECNFIHNEFLTDEPLDVRVKGFLVEEATEHKWAPGYTYHIGKPKFLTGGDLEYNITVIGEYDNE